MKIWVPRKVGNSFTSSFFCQKLNQICSSAPWLKPWVSPSFYVTKCAFQPCSEANKIMSFVLDSEQPYLQPLIRLYHKNICASTNLTHEQDGIFLFLELQKPTSFQESVQKYCIMHGLHFIEPWVSLPCSHSTPYHHCLEINSNIILSFTPVRGLVPLGFSTTTWYAIPYHPLRA